MGLRVDTSQESATGLVQGYVGIMEKKMEATIQVLGFIRLYRRFTLQRWRVKCNRK